MDLPPAALSKVPFFKMGFVFPACVTTMVCGDVVRVAAGTAVILGVETKPELASRRTLVKIGDRVVTVLIGVPTEVVTEDFETFWGWTRSTLILRVGMVV